MPRDSRESPGRVLVVDDDTNTRLSVEALLCSDFHVASAGGVQEAELLISHHGEFDVVVTDYNMPGASGMVLVTRLAESSPETVVIMVTGYSEEPEVRRAQRDQRLFE